MSQTSDSALLDELSRAAYDEDGNQYGVDEIGDAVLAILERHKRLTQGTGRNERSRSTP